MALDHVDVQLGGVLALRDITLRVGRGEFLALIGDNGSGKTTLLRALHGLVGHTGSRTVASGSRRTQAMVFQRPFILRLSVWHNVVIALWLAGVDRRERPERGARALQRAGLDALRGRPAWTLSGGQQQRLALARAWAVGPELLLLDEPTANLDPAARQEIEELLASFNREGMTIVMSTHDLAQAGRLATRIVQIDRGQVRTDLPASRYFERRRDAGAFPSAQGNPI